MMTAALWRRSTGSAPDPSGGTLPTPAGLRLHAVMAALLALAGLPAWSDAGQAAGQAAGRMAAEAFDTASLGSGSHARGCMLLERTIFQVDVLTLDLRLGQESAQAIERLVASGAPRDSVARAALESRNAFVRIEFLRDVGLERFLDGVRSDLRQVVNAGLIDEGTFHSISGNLPRWYAFLEDRGVLEGDRLVYRIRGDTLHSGYRSPSGEWLLRQTDIGPERGRAVLGSYLVEGSSFRARLLDSLIAGDGC